MEKSYYHLKKSCLGLIFSTNNLYKSAYWVALLVRLIGMTHFIDLHLRDVIPLHIWTTHLVE